MTIWMILLGPLTIRLFDFFWGGSTVDAKHLIVIGILFDLPDHFGHFKAQLSGSGGINALELGIRW